MNSSRTQNFTYDELNRVKTAATQATTGTYAWGLQFGYDIWANLLSATVTQGSAPMLSATVGTNNRLTNTGFSYDADGNVLGDGINSYSFDAASQLKTAAGVTYTYDGDGKRVQKSNGKLYWYGTGSEPLAESDASGNITDEYIFFGGRRIAHRKSSGEVDYYFSDQVESARVVTNAAGTVLDDSDFYPFGGERPAITNTSGNNYKFQSKERDTETGNDDFGARYYSSSFGRMLSPDWSAIPAAVPYADLTNPQTLNLYQFVKNDPVLFIDGDGHSISTGATGSNVDPGTQTALQRGGIDGCIMDGSCPHPDLTITGNWYLTIGGSDGEQQGTNASAQNNQPQQPGDRCEAQMRSRPGDITSAHSYGASHAWWYVTDRDGQDYTLSFTMIVPKKEVSTPIGKIEMPQSPVLNAHVTKGSQSSSNANDNLSHGQVIFDTGRSSKVCGGVDSMIKAARSFPVDKIPYLTKGNVTSNSGARYLGDVGGFHPADPSQPGLSAVGWNSRIPGVEK